MRQLAVNESTNRDLLFIFDQNSGPMFAVDCPIHAVCFNLPGGAETLTSEGLLRAITEQITLRGWDDYRKHLLGPGSLQEKVRRRARYRDGVGRIDDLTTHGFTLADVPPCFFRSHGSRGFL